MITALLVFLVTYLFVGLTQVPRIPINRPAGALVGAVLMVVTGVLSLDEAFRAIDMHTLLLLLGMMIITVYLRIAGFFELMAERILSLARTPVQLLVLVSLAAAALSALFVNDTICLLFTPILLEVTAQAAVNPVPYLLALATASNIGSVMTVTGNPQNMLIGIASGIPYLEFLRSLAPVAILGTAVSIAVIRLLYRGEITSRPFAHRLRERAVPVNRPLLAKALVVSCAVLIFFSLGHAYALIAVAGAVALMLIGKESTERILDGVDWTLLLFFAGLFVVMHGVDVSGLADGMLQRAVGLKEASPLGRIAGISLVAAVLSNVVSNVPAVMVLKPLLASLGNDPVLWLALAMSSTLAGNLTLIGSVANLIVVQQARKQAAIGFFEYLRVGAVITALTIALGIAVLAATSRVAHGAEQPAFRGASLTIIPADASPHVRTFRIALRCSTEAERTKGLQGFRKLNRDEAALFSFDPPEAVTFWMATVGYPLDILFVAADGVVVNVARNCRPGSRETFSSTLPVRWVIETAADSGVAAGDRVMFPEPQ